MMQFVYCMRFPAKYAKMKSNCILYCLYHLYHLLPLLQPSPAKVCHVPITLILVMDVRIMSS